MGRRPQPVVLYDAEEMAIGHLYFRHDYAMCRGIVNPGPRPIAKQLGVLLPSLDGFWSRIAEVESGCWEWTGAINQQTGYGHINAMGSSWTTHRLMWTLINGPIPKGTSRGDFCICHRCDNPPCINPDHLFLGSALDNMRDRDAKGRGRNGKTGRIAA